MYQILTTPSFQKDFHKLDVIQQKQISKKLQILADEPTRARKMAYTPKELRGLHTYRISDFRILCWINNIQKEIVLYAIGNRRDIYKKLR